MALVLFNTFGREKQEFLPRDRGIVGMYSCGPTVYNFAHIGNLRAYTAVDVLRRTLEFFGYNVRHVMNVTDVGHLSDDADSGEDKMLRRAHETGMSVWDIAELYTEAFFRDTGRLNILRPTIVCRATAHIPEMIALVERLEKNGYTYRAGGNVYFDISRFDGYGKLALLDRQELQAGARIEIDPNKRNPQDFVLWFTNSKFENQTMIWDSPWGRGYPGWHIECSAMSLKYLGDQFDIHFGGVDHIAVHHTNEIAQSEAATGKRPWVNYWLHNEHLGMDKGKMSKSGGDFLTLQKLTDDGYDPMDYRFFLLGSHYRSQIQFSYEALDGARSARKNLSERISRLRTVSEPSAPDSFGSAARNFLVAFSSHLSDDLNTPRCLSELWGLVKDESIPPADKLSVIREMDRVLGLGLEDDEIFLADEESVSLAAEREAARKSKNFARADEIRTALKNRGILIEDTPNGPVLKRV